ncbi:MAG: hypothetical protein WC280_02005 [Patescibacteria group bacterium]
MDIAVNQKLQEELFLEVVRSKGVSIDDAINIINSYNSKRIEELIINNEEFFLEIDYSVSVRDLLKLGKYDYIDSSIKRIKQLDISEGVKNGNFKSGALKMKIFKFKSTMPSSKIILEMKKQGYRPANIVELLTLGYKYQNIQRVFALVAIGINGKRFFTKYYSPYLMTQNYQRQVGLDLSIYGWDSYVRFLAVSE